MVAEIQKQSILLKWLLALLLIAHKIEATPIPAMRRFVKVFPTDSTRVTDQSAMVHIPSIDISVVRSDLSRISQETFHISLALLAPLTNFTMLHIGNY